LTAYSIATIPTADGGPPVLYTLSVGVNDLIHQNPRTGNIFLEELRKCEVDCAITRVLGEGGAIKLSCDTCVQFDRQLSPELIDLGRDMRRCVTIMVQLGTLGILSLGV
jgi:hypothetical protein